LATLWKFSTSLAAREIATKLTSTTTVRAYPSISQLLKTFMGKAYQSIACHTTGGQYYNSFIVKAYGAHRQRAGFYAYGGGCDALSGSVQDWWADGGSNVFIKGHCVDVPFAYSSLGSRSA